MSVLGRCVTRLRKRGKKRVEGTCEGTGWATRRVSKKEELRGTYERTGWVTRLRKRGKKREESRGMCEGTGCMGYY